MTTTPDDHVPPRCSSAALIEPASSSTPHARPRGRRNGRTRQSLRRLFDDPQAVEVTITLTDEVMRFTSPRKCGECAARGGARGVAEGLWPRELSRSAGRGRAVAAWRRASPLRVVTTRVRRLTAEPDTGRRRRVTAPAASSEHHGDGLPLNVNVLGEAVLGEREAGDRLSECSR